MSINDENALPFNPAVDPDTGIPYGAADGDGEAADPADIGPMPDPDAPDNPGDEAFFHATEPAGEEAAMSSREEDATLGPEDFTDDDVIY